MVLLLDDFHNINTIRLPTQLMLSVAVHMASSLVDIHNTIPALFAPEKKETIHSSATIKLKDKGEVSEKICRGGIVMEPVKQLIFSQMKEHPKSYIEIIPEKLQNMKADNINKQIKEFR
jgi:hypothetical protein